MSRISLVRPGSCRFALLAALTLSWLLSLPFGFAAEASNTTNNESETHWSLKPITRHDVPASSNSNWKLRNPVDHFVAEKLGAAKLSASPEASRRVLIRRLYFDLIGLPPTPEEVRKFEHDPAPDAYERLVELLLESPHYGERWARHWLDVVRFAETHGFEMNQPRPNAWLYRDYVIQAFNGDKPYDRFILEQFAGDVLGEDAATGFLVGGAWDQVKSPDPVLTAAQRADELHDMVSTTGSAFLGLTVGCARCHNHKFDPIPQTDYYAIKACLAGVQHGERRLNSSAQKERDEQAAFARKKLAELDNQLVAYEPLASRNATGVGQGATLRSPVHPRLNIERFTPIEASRLRFTITRTTDAEPCIDELEVYTAGSASQNIALAIAGTKATASSVYPNSEIHRLEHLNDGKFGNSHSWISNERGRGWVELVFAQPIQIERVVWARDREQQFADRLALDYQIEVATCSNDWQVVATSKDRATYVAGKPYVPDYSTNTLSPEALAQLKSLLSDRAKLEVRIKDLTIAPMVYAGTMNDNPEPTFRLFRGDPMQKRDEVQPAAISVVKVAFTSPSSKATLTPDQQRRLSLAQWLASPSNPLPARVMVNRLWQHHFGEGIVSTPSDFGRKGSLPSHPELLDWLASEFIDPHFTAEKFEPALTPWSIKHIQRLIVLSSTYRQSSAARPDCLAIDAASRLLWRYPPQRLEAEPLRDSILFVSGLLDLRVGGPGYSPFEPNDNYVRVYNPKQQYGPPEWRRMIYMTKVRMQQDVIFGAFDCPDGGQIAPKRLRSTTPLQALNLLNSEFIVQQSRSFAERLAREAPSSIKAQIRMAWQLAYGRVPESHELVAAEKFISAHGLTLFCRSIFNSNEFMFID